MKWSPRRTLVMGILVLAAACASETAVAPESTTQVEVDESSAVQEIEAILATYDRVVTEMDRDLFLTIWADEDEISIVSPISRIRSLPELDLFFAGLQDAYSELEIEFSDVSIRSLGSTGWATFDFTVDAILTDGQTVQFGGWETQVYVRTDDGWRIAHIHYSVPPMPPAEA